MDFLEPISYPLKDIKKLVIGGLLIFPGMILLLIPLIIAMGYTVKAAGDTVRGKNDLPEFDNWRYFLMKGLGYLGIDILYTIVIYALFIPAVVTYFIGSSENTVLIVLSAIFAIIAFILAIIIAFIQLISLVRYGEKENISAAFAFGELFRNLKTGLWNYITGFIILLALGIAVYVVWILLMILIIGFLIMGIIMFYFILVEMRMFAQIYRETKEKIGGN